MGRHRKPSRSAHLSRRLSIGIASGALGVTAFGLSATAAQAAEPDIRQQTDKLLFHTSLDDFTAEHHKNNPRDTEDRYVKDGLRWDSDGCSGGPLVSQAARASCERHDFGYRNYQEQGRWTDTRPGKIRTGSHSPCKGAGLSRITVPA